MQQLPQFNSPATPSGSEAEDEQPTDVLPSVPETPIDLQGRKKKIRPLKRSYSQFFAEHDNLSRICYKCHGSTEQNAMWQKKKCNICDKAVCHDCLTAERQNRRDGSDGFYKSLGVDYCDDCLQFMICQTKKNRREADKLRKFRRLCVHASLKCVIPVVHFEEPY
jgi:hypothetical protein